MIEHYLLIGFIIYFAGSEYRYRNDKENNKWFWELITVLLWPLTLVIGVFQRAR